MARLQEANWHHYNQSKSSLCIRRGISASALDKGGSLAPQRSTCDATSLFCQPLLQRFFTSRATGDGSVNFPSKSPSQILPQSTSTSSYSWKYPYRLSYLHCRFLSTKDSDEPKIQPHVMNQTEKSHVDRETTNSVVSNETLIGDIQLKVESVSGPSNLELHTIQKTQDDFADYLNGQEVTLDTDTGFVVPKMKKDHEQSQSPGPPSQSLNKARNNLDATSNLSNDKTNTSSNKQDTTTDPTNNADNLSHYQYIFTPSDATLSGRERYEIRRRAMEQKLQIQQAQSRAATYTNVQRALGGNAVIAVAKLAAALSSGSSAMMSEFVHSVVDCGNQALLLVGLKSSGFAPDRTHPYGYGKAIYFWALVSALGTFFLGAGVSMTHSVGELMNPHMTSEVPWEVWGVLGMSFTVDGYVFWKTVQGISASKRIDGEHKDMSFWKYATTKVRDPATLAVLLEDGAACMGVVIAIGGIGMTQYTGLPVCDAVAGMGISALLGAMGLALVQVNHRFLIGQGLDKATRMDIERIILSRRSIDNIYSVQSQWTGPDTFSYKAEVDFDGTFLAAKLMPRYQQEFFDAKDSLDRDLRVLLSWYAEDVMRAAEREIRHIEEEIRTKYPQAQYIELEPMSKDADRYAIDDGMEAQLRRVEVEVLNRYLKSLYKKKEGEGDNDKTE